MKCELCKTREATLADTTVINNGVLVYHFCEECYASIRKAGLSAFEVMQEVNARKGKECPSCGTTAAYFRKTFMFGCPDCYRNMREVAVGAAKSAHQSAVHVGKRPKGML